MRPRREQPRQRMESEVVTMPSVSQVSRILPRRRVLCIRWKMFPCPLPRPIPRWASSMRFRCVFSRGTIRSRMDKYRLRCGDTRPKRYTILSVVNTSCMQPSHRAAATHTMDQVPPQRKDSRVTWLPIKLIPSTLMPKWWYDPYHRAKSSAKGKSPSPGIRARRPRSFSRYKNAHT